ncbi:MAG: molybdopterin molybdotransferase MoeA [Saprospiraceae bacterium]
MVSVETATDAVLGQTISPGIEEVKLDNAVGRILAENIFADRDFPPFDRATMDGIAFAYEAFENGHRKFPIEGIAAAGAPEVGLKNPLHCIEVMTGAICPEGCDTIIRYEDLEIKDGVAHLLVDEVKQGKNIHLQGEDRRKGSIVIEKGKLLSPAETGVLATVGKSSVKVLKNPTISVVSSGDELVTIDEVPLPHQIRRSNAPSISAVLNQFGIESTAKHLPDDESVITNSLSQWIEEFDIIIMSGGVSMGKFDFIPGVLDQLGVETHFYKVSQRPGKPFWFGSHPGGCKVFAFPGNPVSTFMCTHRYFLPWYRKTMGLEPFPQIYASLDVDYEFKPDLTYFLQVQTTFSKTGQLTAHPVTGHGSGDFANLVDTDAFLELPKGRDFFKKGESFPLHWFRKQI